MKTEEGSRGYLVEQLTEAYCIDSETFNFILTSYFSACQEKPKHFHEWTRCTWTLQIRHCCFVSQLIKHLSVFIYPNVWPVCWLLRHACVTPSFTNTPLKSAVCFLCHMTANLSKSCLFPSALIRTCQIQQNARKHKKHLSAWGRSELCGVFQASRVTRLVSIYSPKQLSRLRFCGGKFWSLSNRGLRHYLLITEPYWLLLFKKNLFVYGCLYIMKEGVSSVSARFVISTDEFRFCSFLVNTLLGKFSKYLITVSVLRVCWKKKSGACMHVFQPIPGEGARDKWWGNEMPWQCWPIELFVGGAVINYTSVIIGKLL